MTTKEAAEALGYTIQHVRLLIRTNKLAAVKSGRDWLLRRDAVEHFRSVPQQSQLVDGSGK